MELHKTDPRIEWLMNKSILLQFVLLRALCEKHRGNKRVQLHQEGLAAWIIQSLPADKKCDVAGLVNSCFSVDYGNVIVDWCEKKVQENCFMQ